jgi:RND family efflux transporter MFP subunit
MNWESLRHRGRRIFQVVVIAAVATAAGYWYFAPVPVIAYQVRNDSIVSEVMGTGTLEARVKSTVSPKISGRVNEILADQGDRVQAGQLLFTLDDTELNQQAEIAQATLEFWKASLGRIEADLAQSKAVLDNAQKIYDRNRKLMTKRAVSEEEIEESLEKLRIAEAGSSRSQAAVAEASKQIATAEKTMAYHQARLADTRVSAPFDGLVVKRFRDPGDIGVPGSPVLTLVSTDEIWVSAWVDETQMSRVRPDQPARVAFRSEPDKNYEGKVARIGRETDRETREFVVDVRVVTLPANWAVGQRAEVYVEVERKPNVPVIPSGFLIWRENVSGVYRRKGDRAEWVAVKLGLRGAERVEVTEGVGVGDTILIPTAGKSMELDKYRVKPQ